MSKEGKIIWLASYPKSGNTWLRTFFANLLSGSAMPVDINDLKISSIASNRTIFDEYSGISSSDLSLEEIERLRPYVYEEISQNSPGPVFYKIHDAFLYTSEGRPMVSENASRKAIYIIRNPYAVAVSFAHHLNISIEKTVEHMNNPDYRLVGNDFSLSYQLEQKLFSWSMHVKSWIEQKEVEVLVVRYEDMVHQPKATFRKAAEFCEFIFNENQLLQAIRNSSFEVLKEQEQKSGFKEKPGKASSFFRKGQSESWKDELDQKFMQSILVKHFDVMKMFGYA